MMKNVDGLSHHIDKLIHHYLVQPCYMRANDIVLRLFDYCYDTFTTCSNPCRITISNTTVVTKSSSLLSQLSIVYHSPFNFTSMSLVQSYSTISSELLIFRLILLPEDILWLYVDSVTTSLGSLLPR